MNVNRALQTVIDMCDDCVTESSNSQNLLPDVSKDDMSSVKSVLAKWNENIKAENSKLSEMGTGLVRQPVCLFKFEQVLKNCSWFLTAKQTGLNTTFLQACHLSKRACLPVESKTNAVQVALNLFEYYRLCLELNSLEPNFYRFILPDLTCIC